MPKLVLLSAGLAGRTHDLTVEKTSVGRVEDNSLQIAEPSVSSHHCEIILQGTQVLVRDLNSTNGTFINGQQITEKVLNPGETLRLGQIEMRLDDGTTPAASAPAAAAAPAPAPPTATRKDPTLAMTRGVNLSELEQGGARTGGFDTAGKGFSKKDNKLNKIFLYVGIGLGVLILALLIYVFAQATG